jgi:hypothetical protein
MESIKLWGRSAASIQLSTGDFYRGFPERSVPADRGAPKLQEAAADSTPVDAARQRRHSAQARKLDGRGFRRGVVRQVSGQSRDIHGGESTGR